MPPTQRDMIRSVLYFQPRDGDYDAVVDFYRRHAVLARAVADEGCHASELQVPRGGSGPILVTALWEDEDAYRRWLGSEFRNRSASELAALIERPADTDAGDLYEVVLAEPQEGGE